MPLWSQVCAPLAQCWNLSCLKSASNYSWNGHILVGSNGEWTCSSSARTSICWRTFSFPTFSIIPLRNVSSRVNLSWIPWKNFFLHFFSWFREMFPVSRLFTISMSVKSSFLDDVLKNWKKNPSCTWWISDFFLFLCARSARTCNGRWQCQSVMKHTLHCVLGSVSSNWPIHLFSLDTIGDRWYFARLSQWRMWWSWNLEVDASLLARSVSSFLSNVSADILGGSSCTATVSLHVVVFYHESAQHWDSCCLQMNVLELPVSKNLQSTNFWNATSSKCSMKINCIRSCLTECQSFPNHKIDVESMHRILMFFHALCKIMYTTWYPQINLFRILVTFISRIN